jgi:hypothetical protein
MQQHHLFSIKKALIVTQFAAAATAATAAAATAVAAAAYVTCEHTLAVD